MGGRHQNFEDPITWTQDIRKTKCDLLGFFWDHPLGAISINGNLHCTEKQGLSRYQLMYSLYQ